MDLGVLHSHNKKNNFKIFYMKPLLVSAFIFLSISAFSQCTVYNDNNKQVAEKPRTGKIRIYESTSKGSMINRKVYRLGAQEAITRLEGDKIFTLGMKGKLVGVIRRGSVYMNEDIYTGRGCTIDDIVVAASLIYKDRH